MEKSVKDKNIQKVKLVVKVFYFRIFEYILKNVTNTDVRNIRLFY